MLLDMKIAIQGQEASFHDVAARQLFGNNIELICCETFADTFQALESDRADFAVVAVENSLHGPIAPVYDLLLKHKPWIFRETYLQIHQCLVGIPGAKLAGITEVYSHMAALSQCDGWLNTNLHRAKRFEHPDTAGAAADIAAEHDKTKAAIASQAAAKQYGLEILAKDIEDHSHNYTRFVALSKVEQPAQDATKTSIVLQTANSSGALYRALGAFDAYNINLTLLTSRPIVGEHQRYMFYVDFEADLHSPQVKNVLSDLAVQKCDVTVLGTYNAAQLPE